MSVSFLVLPSFFPLFFKFYDFLNPSFLPLLCPAIKKIALNFPFYLPAHIHPFSLLWSFFIVILLLLSLSLPLATFPPPELYLYPPFLVILLAFRLHVLRCNHSLFLPFLILLRFPSVICPFHVPRPFLYIVSLCHPTLSSLWLAFHLYTPPFIFPPSIPFISFITTTPSTRRAPPCHCSSSVAFSF